MGELFFEITVIIVSAAVIALLFRLLKQPTVLAFIFTGLLLGPLGLFPIENEDVFHSLSQIGVTLLLFMLGLEMQVSELRSVGKVALLTGVGQILFTSGIGFVICLLLGMSSLSALYASVALTFSSTIIIVKLLSDKKDLNSLYGKIAVGFLLVQDFFAVLALILLSTISNVGGGFSVFTILIMLVKIVLLFGGILFLSKSVFPRLTHMLARSHELLFLVSLAWALGLAAFVSSPIVGFSLEIGGFLAGLSLANSMEGFQIATKVRSIRDFFITIFFVLLGMGLSFEGIDKVVFPSLILTVFVLIGNPIIVMVILGLMGYTKRVGFMAGLTVAQISEFSLIVIILGSRIGHVPAEIVSIITFVGILTFTLSTYGILNGNYLYAKLQDYLKIFEKKKTQRGLNYNGEGMTDHIILAGAHRMGRAFIEEVEDLKENILIIDFDPDVIEDFNKKGFKVLFGDIADSDIQEKANIEKAKMLISSIPDLEDNLFLLGGVKHLKHKPMIIITASYKEEVKYLKKAGANFVVLPHTLIGKMLAKVVNTGVIELLPRAKDALENTLEASTIQKIRTNLDG